MYDETVGRSSSSLSSDLRSLISFLNNFNLDTSLPGRLFYPSTLATIENEFRPSAISTGRASSSQNILQDSSDNSLQINRGYIEFVVLTIELHIRLNFLRAFRPRNRLEKNCMVQNSKVVSEKDSVEFKGGKRDGLK